MASDRSQTSVHSAGA